MTKMTKRQRISELENRVRLLEAQMSGHGHLHTHNSTLDIPFDFSHRPPTTPPAEEFHSSRVLQQCQRCGQLAPPMHTCVFHGSINGAAPSDIVGFSFGHTTQGVAS